MANQVAQMPSAGPPTAPPGPSADQPAGKRFSTKELVLTTFSAVLLALIPIGAGQIFADQAEERALSQEVRTGKAPVYIEMVEAANGYGRVQAVKNQCQQSAVIDCAVNDEDLEKARSRFENAQGQVFMFGSPEALSAVSQMRSAGLNSNLSADGKPHVGPVDFDRLLQVTVNFEVAACKEVRVDGCDSR